LQVRKQDILLDIGCGSGVQIKEVGASGYALAIGVDINWNAIRFARGKSLPNTEFIVADAQHLPIKPASVDKVICAEIIEHLIFPQNLIIEISNVLKKDGEVVITTPNNNLLWKIYEYLWDKFGRGRNYGETHISLFRENKLKHQFMGFSECKTITIFFIAPLLAVSNSNLLLELGKKADRVFERFGWGVSIILHARK
jgi:ubiquinone/menaquinone biosynthesis C-methylase UbiE